MRALLGARQRPDARLQPGVVWDWAGAGRAVFLAFIPRLPSANAPQGGLATGERASREEAAGACASSPSRRSPRRSCCWPGLRADEDAVYVLEQTRPPFDTANVLAVNLPVMSYGKTPQQVQEFYRE
jgi:putative ABC transport system permease protein